MDNIVTINNEHYYLEIDIKNNNLLIISNRSNKKVLESSLVTSVSTLKEDDTTGQVKLLEKSIESDMTKIILSAESSIWDSKEVIFECYLDKLITYMTIEGHNQRIRNIDYFNDHNKEQNTTDFQKVYLPRFDWFIGQVMTPTNQNDSLGCQQWLSPPPFALAMMGESEAIYCGVAPKIGEYNFLSLDYQGQEGPYFRLTYEGHTLVESFFETPRFIIGFGETDCNEAIDAYVKYLRDQGFLKKDLNNKIIPDWWKEPIFCSWGQMRYDYRQDHDGHENGSFINVTNYSTEIIHKNYMDIFDEMDINPGTVIIDMGWAENPALSKPSTKRWSDMRGFIDEQHKKGRKVLLWYTPVVTQGLPLEACMTLDGRPVAPDPTSPVYQSILQEEIYKMLSDDQGCLNGDGFKIDFTQCTPSEEGRFTSYLDSFWALINDENEKYMYKPLDERDALIQTYGQQWGVEILKLYIELIYTNMKDTKADSVLITHTANPYFAEVVDILRLNDLDGECDQVLDVMANRAKIAKMCSKSWLIDTDNDLMIDKKRWRDYIQLQPSLGIPDTYYIKSIATSGELFDEEDYGLLKSVWEGYRNRL